MYHMLEGRYICVNYICCCYLHVLKLLPISAGSSREHVQLYLFMEIIIDCGIELALAVLTCRQGESPIKKCGRSDARCVVIFLTSSRRLRLRRSGRVKTQ